MDHDNLKAEDVKEVWALEWQDGLLLPPADDDGCDEFIAYPSLEAARIAAGNQLDLWGDAGSSLTPVRIHPTPGRDVPIPKTEDAETAVA